MSKFREFLIEIIGSSYMVTSDRWVLSVYGTQLIFKAKRKKSGFKNYDTDILTIVEVELGNPAVANMTVHEVYLMMRNQAAQKQSALEQEAILFKQALEQELKKYNMSLSVFMTLQQSVEKANYNKRAKLGIAK